MTVFRTTRLRDHLLRGVSQGCSQACLVIAFSLMPLASAVAINFSAPLFATLAAIVFLKETVGPARWGALIVGFLGVLLVTSPGAETIQIGSLFALINAVLFGTVTVGVRRMTATESAETLTMYQMVVLTVGFAATLPLGVVRPGVADGIAMAVNGFGNACGQYLWTRALHLAPTSAVVPFNYFSLVWAIILGFLVWGDIPTVHTARRFGHRGGIGNVPIMVRGAGKMIACQFSSSVRGRIPDLGARQGLRARAAGPRTGL